MMALDRLAVIGNPIAHSLSPIIHQAFAQQTGKALHYEKIRVEKNDLKCMIERFFKDHGKGLNVTIPYKEAVLALVQRVSPRAARAGAANTLWNVDGILHADNTDGIGFIKDITKYLNLAGKRVLLLGAGGAARGIIGPLLDEKITLLSIINRTPAKLMSLQESFPNLECLARLENAAHYDLIINAVPANNIAHYTEVFALPNLSNRSFCYDLAYAKNMETPFIQYVIEKGCSAVDGLGMLVEQAAESFFIWYGIRPLTEGILHQLRNT